MILYNIKSDDSPNGSNVVSYRITKFDEDLNPESSYLVSPIVCECPAGVRDTCRHRKMLPLMLDRVDTAWFYCFDDKQWYDPTGQAHVMEVVEARDDIEEEPPDAPAPDLTNEVTIAWSKELPDDADVAEEFSKLLSEPTKLRRLR